MRFKIWTFEDNLLSHRTLCRNLGTVAGTTILGVIGPDGLRYLNIVAISESERSKLVSIEWIFFLLALAVALLLFGFDFYKEVLKQLRLLCRRNKYRGVRIGILYDPDQSIERVNTNIAPEEWGTLLEEAAESFDKKLKVELIKGDAESLDSYHAIVNPFGSNYPESSFGDFPVYRKILEYVEAGGMFVNVADIPTYFAHNSRLKRKLDRTPYVYDTAGRAIRLFIRVPLMEELSVMVTGIDVIETRPFKLKALYQECKDDRLVSLKTNRVALTDNRNVESIVEEQDKTTSLFFCSYGAGRCLISLNWLGDNFSENRPLANVISRLIVNQL